jgi:hypothetical protein
VEAKPKLVPLLTADVVFLALKIKRMQQALDLQFPSTSRGRSGEWVQRWLVVQTDLERDSPIHGLLQLSLH